MKNAGLNEKEWSITDEAIRKLIRLYTREAGVRNLDRALANLTRKATREILKSRKKKTITVTDRNLKKYAGVPPYTYGIAEKRNDISVFVNLSGFIQC